MSHYLIFFFGVIIGVCAILLLFSLMPAKDEVSAEQDRQDWEDAHGKCYRCDRSLFGYTKLSIDKDDIFYFVYSNGKELLRTQNRLDAFTFLAKLEKEYGLEPIERWV